LGRLRQLPVDQIKIDRSFVAGLGHSRDAEVIVCAVIRLGRSLGLRVVAEGVETAAQCVPSGGGLRRGAGFPHRPAVASERLRDSTRGSPLRGRAAEW
jgi:predicted signal transduction protein with EAL and GGDEF domain